LPLQRVGDLRDPHASSLRVIEAAVEIGIPNIDD
jgi:hypothetical protein